MTNTKHTPVATLDEVAAGSDQLLRALIAERAINKELLEALEKVTAALADYIKEYDEGGHSYVTQARAVINKAKGE